MHFYSIALVVGATAVAAGNTATLLLPGFKGHDLQAGIIDARVFTEYVFQQHTNNSQNGDATTYKITCPQTVSAGSCGIAGEGMTAIAAPTSMQLQNINLQGTTGTLSCNIAGTTYADCQASAGTATPSGTLRSGDLNWMPVTVTGPCSTSTPTPTATPTSTVFATSTSAATSTATSSSSAVSSPKKSTSAPASSSTPSSPPPLWWQLLPLEPSGAPAASSTAFNAAGQVAASFWTVGGAFAALAYAFA
ncbi:uncharacterized protein N7529_006166 [Penicillium soppii]|uniref:uncharacterized protein n=1 Tax=Penicillium soppii TaxID=69789 RepID=UPI002547F236|nr:uncharacterized protein N7529_006166 [Penicillium soppii]KAJ5864250.1 hypothetical protein N7529_006166 [Penicillium soppii]